MIGALAGGALAPAVAAAQAIVAIDPLHLDARLLLAYDADRRAGWVLADVRVARTLVGPSTMWERDRIDPRRAVAILEQARRDAPRAASLTVGSAWILVAAGLPGEASSRLEVAQAGELAELRDDVRGLLALEAGAVAVYRAWRTRRGGEASPFVTDVRAPGLGERGRTGAARDRRGGRGARGGGELAGAAPRARWGVVSRVAMDDRAPPAVRERAIARSTSDVERAVFRHCLRARLPRLSCRRLHDAYEEIASEEPDDVTAAVTRLAEVPSTSETWLLGASWADVAQLRTLAPRILALEGTAPSLTQAWAALAVQAALAQGDLDLARRLLADHRTLLTPLGQLAADLAIADVTAGRDVEAAIGALGQVAATVWPVVTAPRADQEPVRRRSARPARTTEDDAPGGDAAALAAAILHLYDGRGDSTAAFTALRTRHPGPEAAALDVLIALAGAARRRCRRHHPQLARRGARARPGDRRCSAAAMAPPPPARWPRTWRAASATTGCALPTP